MFEDKKLVDAHAFVKKVAAKNNWALNKDEEFLGNIVEGLLMNLQRLGYYQCPCRLSWDDRSKDADIICPCVYAKEDIAEFGHCFCSLYLSEEFDLSGAEPTSIPERRPQEKFPD
jgi:ferredoxin-thioredoxin reductase catalytic chain